MAKGTKEFSDRQEKLIAAYLDWKQVTGSGSRPNYPGDVSSTNWLGECKTHIESGHKIVFDFKVWDKICEEAASQFKLPVLFSDDGSQLIDNIYCLLKAPDQVSSNIPDYTDCSNKESISFNCLDLKLKSIPILKRKNDILLILSLRDFKQFIQIED